MCSLIMQIMQWQTHAMDWLLAHEALSMAACSAGQSVGSGPTCHLAAKTPDLAGVVLHSALASGEPPSGSASVRTPLGWLARAGVGARAALRYSTVADHARSSHVAHCAVQACAW